MRNILLIGLATVSACSVAGRESRGTTAREYSGRVQVVFTNASPDTMCGLYMSYDSEDQYGDNWLAANGLKSGQSVKFWVKQGAYKARWDTCRASKESKFFAGTMCSQMAIDVQNQTQIFAYVADKVAPTSRAAVLPSNEYKLVKFPGQIVEPITTSARASTRIATATMSHTEAAITAGEQPVAATETPMMSFNASEFVEKPTAKMVKTAKTAVKTTTKTTKTTKRARPQTGSIAREHDVASQAVRVR